jgi:two-component system, chemotaxis family, chemotaxis protein CheY
MEIHMTSHTILVVDDSRVSRMLVRAIIDHANKQTQVIEASNGEEALIKTESTQIHIAILDLNMPGMDGLALATKLLARFPEIKIGLLTANIQDIVRQKAEALGITFIPKPITEERILGFIDG